MAIPPTNMGFKVKEEQKDNGRRIMKRRRRRRRGVGMAREAVEEGRKGGKNTLLLRSPVNTTLAM